VVEFVGPPGVVEEPRGHQGHVDVAALLDRLAVVEGLGDGEFAGAFLHEAGDPEEVLSAVTAGELRPGAVVGAAGGGDGGVDIRRVGMRDHRDRLLGGRVDGLERNAPAGDEIAVDEQAVVRAEVQHCLGLRCRSVVKKAHW